MSIAVIQQLGEQNYYTSSGASVTYTLSSAPQVGSHLFVVLISGFTQATWTYSDGQNSPVQDQAAQVGAGEDTVYIWRVPILTSSAPYQITLTPNLQTVYANICALEVRGLASSPFDQAVNGTGSPGVTLSSGTLAKAQEFILAAFADDSFTNPDGLTGPSSPWTTVFLETNGASNPVSGVVYQVVSSTTPVSASWSGGSGSNGVGMMNTYKGGNTAQVWPYLDSELSNFNLGGM